MFKYIVIIFVISFSLISCTKKELNKKLRLEETGENFSIKLDDQTPNVSLGFSTFGDLLFNVVWEYNQIQIYDIQNGSLIKKLNFAIEGDQGVGQIFGFHIHNLDSIFLFGQVAPVIYLTDTSGIIKNKIEYEVPDGYSSAFVHPHYFVSAPKIRGNELIVKTHITGNYREVNNDQLSNKALGYSINLLSGKTNVLSHNYPDDYLINGLKHFEHSMAIGDGKVVYSFFGDHRLFFASSFEDAIQSKNAGSQYLDASLRLFPVDGERLETLQYMNTSSRYDNLIYDPFRNIYYRFAYPTLDISDQAEIQRLRIAPGPFVVMILDQELNVIGETYFSKGKYLPTNFFIHENGLFLSINHPDNPENKEDEFKFELLKVSEIQD